MTRLACVRTEPLNLQEVIDAVARPEAGAVAAFSGLVRNNADGQPVTLLEYEAYPSMAEKEMARLMEAIEVEVSEVRLAALHRVGALQVGDLAIVCAASAPHRVEAIRACHLLIDRIKEHVPIWKREHGPGGPYWVGWQDARCVSHASHGHDRHQHHLVHDATLHSGEMTDTESTQGLAGLRLAILTVSDTRKVANDDSGRLARELLIAQGATIVATDLIPDEPIQIRTLVQDWAHLATTDAIIITGGTGIAARDQTIEAVQPLFLRHLDGFGEAFRRLSYDEIGPHAILSRALAGVIGTCLVFVLPGSPNAVRLALSKLIVPLLPHASRLIRGQPGHHHGAPPL